MAIVKAVHSKASIAIAINYITKKEKTDKTLISGKDCSYYHAIDEMKATKAIWNKKGGREYCHYVQSFADGEKVTPEQAHEMARRWAEKQFKGYECIVATHVDKEHIHSHIVVNSVNFENGHKWSASSKWLEKAKAFSDQLCLDYGMSITEKGKTFDGATREDMTSYDKNDYNLLTKAGEGKAESWKLNLSIAVIQSKKQATSRQDFINIMSQKGYETKWEDNNKYITFTDRERQKKGESKCKIRNNNIEKTFKVEVSKEELENEFKRNRGREEQRGATARDNTKPDNKILGRNPISENEPIRSGADESRKRTTETDLAELYRQLHGIRGISNEYNPRKRRELEEEFSRPEPCNECEDKSIDGQQPSSNDKSRKNIQELRR